MKPLSSLLISSALMLAIATPVTAIACDCDKAKTAQSGYDRGAKAKTKGEMPCMKMLNKPAKHAGHAGHGNHAGHNAAAGTAPAGSPVVAEFDAANAKMHRDMAIAYTGDADIDMLRGMIPHHQGAIEMAQVVLRYGQDAQVRRLAKEIIWAQELEIKWMRKYLESLEQRGARPTPANATPRATWHDKGWSGSTWLGER